MDDIDVLGIALLSSLLAQGAQVGMSSVDEEETLLRNDSGGTLHTRSFDLRQLLVDNNLQLHRASSRCACTSLPQKTAISSRACDLHGALTGMRG